MRTRGLVFALLLSSGVRADPPAPVPDTLFGVKLGAIYQAGDGRQVGTFPVAALTGMKPAPLGHGAQIYFRPLKENKRFPYAEIKKAPDAEYFDTPYRLYVWPVLTPDLTKAMTSGEKGDALMKWEVGLVEWSDKAGGAFAAYLWAAETCKDFALDLNRKPEVVDSPASNMYSCKFTSGDRELKIHNVSEIRLLQLSFVEKAMKMKEAVLDAAIRQMRMDQTRPY